MVEEILFGKSLLCNKNSKDSKTEPHRTPILLKTLYMGHCDSCPCSTTCCHLYNYIISLKNS